MQWFTSVLQPLLDHISPNLCDTQALVNKQYTRVVTADILNLIVMEVKCESFIYRDLRFSLEKSNLNEFFVDHSIN